MMDENPAHLVTGKVRVLSYQEFKALPSKEQRDPKVYYYKEYYNATKLKFCDGDPVCKNELVKEDFPIDLREYWLHFFSQQPDEWTPAKIQKYVNIFVEHEIRESSIHLLNPKFLSEVMNITIGHDILKILELRDFILKTKKETDLNIIDDSTPPSPAKRRSSIESKRKSPQGTTKSVAVKKSHEKVKVKKEIKIESESSSESKESSESEEEEVELKRNRPTTRSTSQQRRASQEKLKELKNKLEQDKQRTGNKSTGNESQSLTPSVDSPVIKVPTHAVKSVIAKPTSQPSAEPKGKTAEVPPQRPTLQSPNKPKEAPRISTSLATGTNSNPPATKNNTSNNNTNTTRGPSTAPSTARSAEDVTVTTTASPGKTKTVSPFAMLDNMKEVGYKFSGATRSHVGVTTVKASSFSAHRSTDMVDLKLRNKAQSEPRLSPYTPLPINKLTPKKNIVLDDDSEDEKVAEVEEITSTSATPRNSPEQHQVYDVEEEQVVNEVVNEVVDVDEAPAELEQPQQYSDIGEEYANAETQHYEAEHVQPIPPVQPAGYYHANVGLLTGESRDYYPRPSHQEYSDNYSTREGHAEDQRIHPVLHQQLDKDTLAQLESEKHDSRNQLLDEYVAKMVPVSMVATAEMFQVEDIESSPSPVRQKVLPTMPRSNSLLNRLVNSLRDVPNDPFVNNMYSEHSDPLRYSSESFSSQADASQVTDSQLAAILPTPLLQQQQQRQADEQAQLEQANEVPEQDTELNQSIGELDQSRDGIRPWQSQREVVEVASQYIDEELPDDVLSQMYDQYAELSQLPQHEPGPEVIEIPSTSTPVHIRNRDIATQPQPQTPVQLAETQAYVSYNSHERSPHNSKKRKFQEMIQISSSSSLDSDEEFSPIPMPTDSSASGQQVPIQMKCQLERNIDALKRLRCSLKTLLHKIRRPKRSDGNKS